MNAAIWHHLPSGGAKRALFDQVRGLLQRGHRLEAWCPPTAVRQFLPLDRLIVEHEVPLGNGELPALQRWLWQYTSTNARSLSNVSRISAHAVQCAAEIERQKFDVLLAAPCQWMFAPTIGRHVTIPKVLYLQEPARHLYEATPALPWVAEESDGLSGPFALRKWLGSAIRLHPLRVQAREEWINVRAFDMVLVNSHFSRESVLRSYGVDARVCYLGIDTERFANHNGDRQPVVISVGQLSPHKNPEFIIHAVAAAKSKPTLVWIANAAPGMYAEEMSRLAGELNVTLQIRVDVPEDELVKEYQRAIAMLYAPNLEPFGFVPLEANACGTAVIARAEGGVRETVVHGQNGLLVESPIEMAAAIDRFVAAPCEATTLGQKGAALVRERWTLAAATDRLEGFLKQAVEENPRRRL